eukprot:m51a1_g4437 hypothetical protein (653) ;mRNA; r:97376-100766
MITTSASGLEKPEAQYPLDIDASAAADWLVDRRRVPSAWRRRQPALHRAIAAAVAATPAASGARAALAGVGRVTAREVALALEAAMREEPQTNSLLGRYTSPVLYAWNEAAKAAKSELLGLADVADEPALHRAIAAAVAATPAASGARAALAGVGRVTAREVALALEAAMREEPQTKSLLGRYTSPVLYAWNEAAKAAKSELLGLADVADEVSNLIKYEAPAARKGVEAERKHAAELDRQADEIRSTIAQYQGAYASLCSEWGVEGADVRAELRGLSSCLPSEFESVVGSVRSNAALASSCALYRAYAAAMRRPDAAGADELPALALVMREEAVLTPEAEEEFVRATELSCGIALRKRSGAHAKKGRKPAAEAAAQGSQGQQQQQQPQEAAKAIEIDWSAITAEVEAEAAAPAAAEAAAQAPEIDWSAYMETEEPKADGGAAEAAQDFAIELEAAGEAEPDAAVTPEPDAAATSPAPDAPQTRSATAVLSEWLAASPALRKAVLGNLMELRAFLRQRIAEAREDEGTQEGSFISCGAALPAATQGELSGGVAAVDAVLALLQSERVMRLLELGSSTQYVDRIARSFDQKVECRRGAEQSLARNRAKRAEAEADAARARERVDAINARTQQLCEYMRAAIAELFPNRVVTVHS